MNRRDILRALAAVPFTGLLADRMLSDSPLSSLGAVNGRSVSASMWAYLWDLVDDGYDVSLSRLKENGLTSVSLATAYHAGRFLAPHNPKRKIVFLEDGTVYFNPDPALYATVKPLVNGLVGQGQDLDVVRRECEKRGLETRAWVVCCHNTALGMRYPEITCETVFGDKLYHNLCPSNNDVRAYLRAMVKDIASHGVSVIELEAMQFQGYAHGFHHEREGIVLTPAIRFLLGICFCPSCRTRAAETGYSLEEVGAFVKKTLEAHFDDPSVAAERAAGMETLPAGLFGPLHAWRQTVVHSLAQELAEAAAATSVKLRPLVSLDPLTRLSVGMDAGKVAAVTGGILVPGYVRDGSALAGPLAHLQTIVGPREISVGFQVGLPESGGKAEFLSRMRTARQSGITSFNFYNYGFIPLRNLAWIKEGLDDGIF